MLQVVLYLLLDKTEQLLDKVEHKKVIETAILSYTFDLHTNTVNI